MPKGKESSTKKGDKMTEQQQPSTTTSTTTTTGSGFRMEVKQQPTNKKRKRHHNAAAAVAVDEFGGGGDDQQQEATTIAPSSKPQQEVVSSDPMSPNNKAVKLRTESPTANPTAKREKLTQPDGWRVKLYRLNADGSWDDCGTGRVLCLYRPNMAKAKMAPIPSAQQGGEHNAALDAWICQELGEPTLCMHAELVSESTQPRILLRTRILLRDAYQRQGDNIITWCEPYYDGNNSSSNNSSSSSSSSNTTNSSITNEGSGTSSPAAASSGSGSGNSSGGVDLALSFQDNAGCLDIWRQITHVQRRAAELYRTHQQGDGAENNGEDAATLDADSKTNSNNNAMEVARKIAQDHHAELERQQHHEMWVSMAGAVQHQNHHTNSFEGDENTPLHHHNQQHNQQHHHGRINANANAANQNVNKQQTQQLHDQPQQQQQHMPFSGDDGTTDLAPYNPGGGSPEQGNMANNPNNAIISPQLPNPPTLSNLEEIADTIARVQVSSKEARWWFPARICIPLLGCLTIAN